MDRTPVNSKQSANQAWKAGSPFQVRKANQRPQIRFKSPVQTDKWLSEREKTDYTYAQSASYSSVIARLKSLEELAIAYITPILSRRGREPVMRPDEAPVTPARTPRRRQTNLASPSSTRRSARIAARGRRGLSYSRDEEDSYTTHVTKSVTTTREFSLLGTSTDHVHADDSPRSSLSNGTDSSKSWQSRNHSDSMTEHRTLTNRQHVNNRNRYINHLYGLDEDNYGEYSDDETSLATARDTTSYTTTSSWETHHCDEESSSTLSSTISTLSKSAILYPFSVLYYLTTTILSVVSYVMFAPVAGLYRAVQNSSGAHSSIFHSIYSMCSRCVHYMGMLLYRCFTSILLWDVWALTRIRELFLGFLGVGYAASSSALTSASSTTIISESQQLEKERRRRGFCLCLLLLLLLPFLFYLLMGAAPILLAALSKNETKVEETIDESAFIAGTGCMKCLRKEDLMVLIGGVVKNQMAVLQSQIDTQNQRIIMLQQTRTAQEDNIQTLTDQLAMVLAQKDSPNKETLVYINSLETQLTSLRGDLRNVQMAQAQEDKDSDKDMIGIAALGLLRTDVESMEEAFAALKQELKHLHSSYHSDVYRLKSQDRHLHGDVNIIGSRLNALENRVSDNAHGIDRRIGQLQQALQGLESEQVDDRSQLALIASQIGVVESNMTATRNELRELRSELAAAMVSADKLKELEDKMALNADVQVLKSQVTDLQSIHIDGAKTLRNLESSYQTLLASVTLVQNEVTQLQENVQDIEANKYGATLVSLEQLQKRLSELEKNSQDLHVSMQQMQDLSSEKVDADIVDPLQNSVTDLDAKLNQLRNELKTLSDRVAGFINRIDSVQSNQEQGAASSVAMFGTIKDNIAILHENSNNFVHASTHESDLNELRTDVKKSEDKLAADISGVRTDLHSLEVVDGSSKLVGDVTKLQAVLESVRTQLQGLDTSNTGGVEPTVAVDLAELRSEIEQTTRDVQRNRASITSINSTIVILQNGQQDQSDSIEGITKSLDNLRDDLSAMMTRVDEINSMNAEKQQTDAMRLEVSTLQSQLDNVKADIGALQQQLAQLSAKSVMVTEYEALVDDVSSLQAAVAALQGQFVSESGGNINILHLVNRVNSLGDLVDKYEESGMFAAGGAFAGQGSDDIHTELLQKSLSNVQDELSRLQRDLATLNGSFSDKEGETQKILKDIAAQLASVEASIEGLRSSQQGVNADVDEKIGTIEQLMGSLKDELMKMQSDVSDTFGAAAGASVREELVDVKANLSDLNEQQIKLLAQIKDCCNKTQLADVLAAGGYSGSAVNWTEGFDEEKVRDIVMNALYLYNADKTGMVDYALESAGGSVVSTRCSETFTPRTALFTIMGIPLWYSDSSPRSVIQPDMHPGNCWAFKGSEGYLVIQLSGIVKPTAFSMEHIPKSLSPTGTLDSAPREFSVWSLNNEYDGEGALLGSYEYSQEGNPLQFFTVDSKDVAPTGMVELKIHSNHGNLEYTCLYRFRVHGSYSTE